MRAIVVQAVQQCWFDAAFGGGGLGEGSREAIMAGSGGNHVGACPGLVRERIGRMLCWIWTTGDERRRKEREVKDFVVQPDHGRMAVKLSMMVDSLLVLLPNRRNTC